MSQNDKYRRNKSNGFKRSSANKQIKYRQKKKKEHFETRRKAAKSFDGRKPQNDEKYLKLNLTIKEQQFMIESLQKQIAKQTDMNIYGNMSFERPTTKPPNISKEISNLRKKLKLAINDYEQMREYYKKQMDNFKSNQEKWLREQSIKSTEKQVTKYIFGDDIKKIQLRKTGVRIYFNDGENCIFENIEVVKPKGKGKKKVQVYEDEYNKKELLSGSGNQTDDALGDNDMVILMLNELRSRVRDFKHRNEEDYYSKIQERYDQLPIYHIDDEYLNKLKSNNKYWIQLFKKELYPIFNGKRKGKLGAFFKAQKEMKNGKQPMICIQNNVVLNNINKVQKTADSKSIQERIDMVSNETKWDGDSKNDEMDEDLSNLEPINILNGWYTAQIEIKQYDGNPSICIKNNILLNRNANRPKRTVDAKYLQKRLNDNIAIDSGNNKIIGHNKIIDIDKGDSTDEEEEEYKGKLTSNIMKGWFSAQTAIINAKQPTICVQNNVILNNIKKKKKKVNANVLQKKLDDFTSINNAPSSTTPAHDDTSDEDTDDDVIDFKMDENNNGMHENAWFYRDKQRTKFIKSLKMDMDGDQSKLLLQIGMYLNRLIPTSEYYEMVKDYFPIYANPYDIMAACFDGVLLSILINFIDEDLIDLRALHLPNDRYPISKREVVENMWVVKLSITSLDLHQFPDFGIDFEMKKDDILLFCWFNPKQTVGVLLLIVMHQFMGMMDKKINVFNYPELFRLCQERDERKTAQKTACKEWLNRWIIYMRRPKIKKHGRNTSKIRNSNDNLFSSIDLGGYHQSQQSSNISWESIKIFGDDDKDSINVQYIYDTNRDFYDDIVKIHTILEMKEDTQVRSIVSFKQDCKSDRNYLLQLMYLSDIFIFKNKIAKLSTAEHKSVIDYLKKKDSVDEQLIAWINSFKIFNENHEFQYVDNLGEDINDGTLLLKLLEHCKQGCVDWKSKGIRVSSNIRHKFDKLANCNIVVSICDEAFKDIFYLVGMGGNDIVDQNRKYIRGLLSQMQRYHSTKLFAKILFKKKAVTDEELLIWMNNRLIVYKQMVNTMNKMKNNHNNIILKDNVKISNFQDKNALSDCINFCNIVSSIQPEWINYEYIHDESECKFNGYLFKMQNAKYLITVMRKLCCDNIFISAKDLIQCEHRAVLAVSVAIMTTAARYNEYDQLPIFAKTLKQVREKMQKQ